MKKTGSIIFTVLMLVSWNVFSQASAPFTKGVHFNMWFEQNCNNAQEISFKRYVEQDFADVKKMGVDVIRLPIDFFLFTSGPGYIIDPFLFKLLDKAVDWAEKYQINIILNNQPADQPPVSSDYRIFLLSVWTQMADHYKNRSEYVIYEILNEPNRITADVWGNMQGDVINAIRKIDKNHWIVVSGVHTGDNAVEQLFLLPKYEDNKLLYTFHFYDPAIFTHQGATLLTEPLLASLSKIPFPYDKKRMPSIPKGVKKGSYVENQFKNYSKIGTTAALEKIIGQAADFAKQRNVPVFCGEFSVYMNNVLPEDRLRWYKFVKEAFEARNISWITYGYYDPFGIFNPPNGVVTWWIFPRDINTDLNVELVRALGLNPPPQRQREPLRESFIIYDDYLSRGSTVYSGKQNTLNFYYTPTAAGEYAIQWGNIKNNGDSIIINLPINDFTYLAQNGFVLEFKAKTEKPVSFNLNFGNKDKNITWHNAYYIDKAQLPPDGKWHTIRIPLRDMEVWGGWDDAKNQDADPKGRAATWANIAHLQMIMWVKDDVWEIFFDDIKITK
ncbi:MAG: glycoside hydrolase family 5 protein [Treponema sp.]|jgi:endoglucanase|nr:glycoside hydrolase family 5 protein [Treponema sp.]